MPYRWCVVQKCTNTSIRTPKKIFVTIPKNAEMRKKWLLLASRNPKDISASTHAFICEDHFNIEKDMANYIQYKMGFSQTILMVKGAVPSKFDCQEEGRKRLAETMLPQTLQMKRAKTGKETRAAEDMLGTRKLEDKNVMPDTAVYMTHVKIEKPTEATADMLGSSKLEDKNVMPGTAGYSTHVKIEKESEDAEEVLGTCKLEDKNVMPGTAVYVTHVKIEKETEVAADIPRTSTLESEKDENNTLDSTSAFVKEDHKLPVVSTVHVDVTSLVTKFNSMKAELEEMRDRLEASESTIRDLRNELLQLKCNNSLSRSPKHPIVSINTCSTGTSNKILRVTRI